MRNLIKMELKKAFGNWMFLISLVIGLVIAGINTWENIDSYLWNAQMQAKAAAAGVIYTYDHLDSCYRLWMGMDYGSAFTSLFYVLLPLLACLGYGWSYFGERRSGYVMNVVARSRKKSQYFLAKYIAVFLSGGAVILIPMLCNFLAVACFVPAYLPEHIFNLYIPVNTHFLRDLYFSAPILYTAYVMLLDFLFAGLLASCSMALAFFIKNKFAVVLVPFLSMLVAEYFQTNVWSALMDTAISPTQFLQGFEISQTIWEPILLWGLFLLAFSLGTVWRKGAKDDVL